MSTAELAAAVRAKAQPVGSEFRSYRWAPTVGEVAARHGLRPEVVLKFDQNTPPLPGIPQVPLAASMARLNDYPDGGYVELRAAAAVYAGLAPENVVVGAGADDLIVLVAQTFLGPGSRAAIAEPTYGLYRIATGLRAATVVEPGELADVHWCCNPNNPTGSVVDPEELVELARSRPDAVVVVDEAYVEYGARSASPWVDDAPNLVVIRTLSKAFGFAGLRVGYAVAHPETAALLNDRRAPAPVSAPAARIAAAALREPRLLDLGPTIVERERVREALVAAGHDCPPVVGNFVWLRTAEPLGERLEEQGIVVRVFAEGIRVTIRRPSENDVLLAALGAEPGRAAGREATVLRTTTETALRLTLDLDGSGLARVATGVGFLDHLLTLLAFHAGFDLELLAGGDLEVDAHHTVEDALAALGRALGEALGSREGVTRYGSAVVPMDEARATAAVDLVRRAHAEVSLTFGSDHVGSLPTSLVAHALERFAIEAGCTVHVESAGADDHHVAEAAFKALGRALGAAVAPSGSGIRSTKGAA
ncbi:MAG: aminotransferase class I/II-fold pyridoxal phosphate-dependent enzyme [Thermoleophilia bacterium]|nr:aminotransferase class I/II-fold pyridoxal phosphate-dependent enzyme [Thermoleophilia bacterium]